MVSTLSFAVKHGAIVVCSDQWRLCINQFGFVVRSVCFPSGTKALGNSVSVEVVSDAGFKVRLFHVQNKD